MKLCPHVAQQDVGVIDGNFLKTHCSACFSFSLGKKAVADSKY